MTSIRSLLFAVVALAPGVTAWWTGRRLERATEDPALPELLLSRNQRIVPVLATTLALLIVLAGTALYWSIPLIAAGMLLGSYPLRRALRIETAGLGRYLRRSLRSIVGSFGFWILLAWTPQIVVAVDPRYRWVGLALLPILLAWEMWYSHIWLRLHDAVPLQHAELQARFGEIAQRAGILPPAVYRIGSADARFTNAFAFPSVRQPAIGLGNTLIELLEPDETAAIYAHELAHIEHFSPRRVRRWQLMNRLLIMLAVALPLLAQTYLPGFLRWIPIVWPIVVIGSLLTRARTRQREEHESDLRAAALCGDREAVVRGLIKVHLHGFLPRRWPVDFERNASHPSLARRIQALRGEEATHAPAAPVPVVLATAREGTVVVFEGTRGHWFDGVEPGTAHDVETLREVASSVRSVAWSDLVELRVTARGSERTLRAAHRNGDTWSVPIAPDQVATVQRALDTVDMRLHRELRHPPVVTVRLVGALSVLALLVTMQLGYVVLPAALAFFWPGVAAAVALGASALLQAGLNALLEDGPQFLLPAGATVAVLLAVATAALWVAWRTHRQQPVRAGERVTLAVLGGATMLMAALSVASAGTSLTAFADAPAVGAFCVAAGGLAGAILVTSARWARWAGGAAMAMALVALGVRMQGARLVPRLTAIPATAVEEGRLPLEGSVSDLRISPGGTHYLVQRFHQADRRRPEMDHLVGSFGATQRRIADAIAAAFADDDQVLVLRSTADSLVLQLEKADSDSVVWAVPLPELLDARLTVSPDDRTWTVTGQLPSDSLFAASGTLSAAGMLVRHLPPADESGTVEVLAFDGGASLVVTAFDFQTQLPTPMLMLGLTMPKVALWQISESGRRRTGDVPGYPQCGAADRGQAACFVRGRRRGSVYTLGADGVPRARGILPDGETYLVMPGPGARLTATDRFRRVLDVDAEAGRVTEIRVPEEGFVMTASIAAGRLALVRQDSAAATLVWYRVSGGR